MSWSADGPGDQSAPGLLPIIFGGLAAPAAALKFWMVVDDIPSSQAFASPVPYLLCLVTVVVVLPIYLAFRSWFGFSLIRLAGAGLLLALPPALWAYSYFLLPRAHFAATILIGSALTGAFTFWACICLSLIGRRRTGASDPDRRR